VPEDEEPKEGEDLFEDLDKFFAPIRDVDWPEATEPSERRSRADTEAEGEPEEDEGEPEETEAGRGSTMDFETRPGDAASETEREPASSALFTERDERESEQAGEDAEAEEPGVGSFLLESEAEEYDSLEDEEEEAGTTSEYVELPEDESEVAELVEETEAPDIEAVEAAAEHFAESVRDEVQVDEPEEPSHPTEEVAISQLLGEEGAENLEEPEPARTVRVGAEGFGGPSWQEPTAIEVGADTEGAGPGRNVPTAFLTGIVLVGLAVGAILLGAGPFAIFAGLVVLFAQGEFYLALQKRHYQPATALGLVSGALVLGAGYYRGENAMLAIMALSLFATFLWYMTVPQPHRRNVVSNTALTVLGVAYIPLLAAYALAVLKLPDGEGLTLSIIGLTFVYDTAAFGVGYFWGSRPLAPNISPKKSWEGAIGATLVVIAVAVGVVAPNVSLLDTIGRSVGLAVVVALFAPLGDLAESLLKRDLGIKDMGGILPGHGGVMDRIDSVLFVAPAAFIYLRLILL
jgi:phosphatidate cytidylyltransferase